MFYVYTLSDPRSGDIRWVGQTYHPQQRLQNHINENMGCGKNAWSHELGRVGLKPHMEFLDSSPTREGARAIERQWIRYFLDAGEKLFNNQYTASKYKETPAGFKLDLTKPEKKE